MADPVPYKRSYSFTNYQADEPAKPLPGNRVDIELDDIAERSRALTDRVNAGFVVSLNQEQLETVADNIDEVVFVAENMPDIRAASDAAEAAALSADEAAAFSGAASASAGAASASAGAAAASAVTASNAAAQAAQSAVSVPPALPSLSALASAISNGDFSNGQILTLHGTTYKVDSTATGLSSALYGLGIDGLRGMGDSPLNFYVFPGFKEQDITFQYLFTSPDGINFNRMNQNPMPRGGGDAPVGGRDCQLFWCRETGEWIMPVTAGIAQAHDYSVWRSPDLITWRLQPCILGATGVRGKTLPGGAVPVSQIWGPIIVRDGGDLYVIASLRHGPDYTNGFGNNAPCFRPFIARITDLDTMTTEEPTEMAIRTTSDAMLSPDFFEEGGVWYCCIKNSVERNIEIWSGPSLVSGPWTYHVTLDLDAPNPDGTTLNSLEGPTWGLHRYFDAATGELRLKYRVYVANNRDADDKLIGIARYYQSVTSPISGYGSPNQVQAAFATRNFVMTNVALEPDPRAMMTLRAATSSFSGQRRDKVDATIALDTSAPVNLYPQQDWLYYVEGNNNVANVAIREKVADRFWIASLSIYETTGVNVSGPLSRAQQVGFASPAFHVVEFRWDEHSGTYIAVNGTKKRFRAHLASDQSVNGTATLSLATEAYDIGDAFAANAWVPGRGMVDMRAQATIANAVAGEIYRIAIQKNGTDIATARAHGGVGGAISVSVAGTDWPESADSYTIAVTTSAARNVSSTTSATFFEGWQV